MKGNYFFKWLFLTVLSVSVLHFRESNSLGHCQTEQLFSAHNIVQKRIPGFEYCQKLSKARAAGSVYFKNPQHCRLADLSNSLTAFRHPEFSFNQALAELHVQNQHFRSRSLSSDDHSISHS
ncbi:hypothetical protein [Dyadobacter sp. BHUBP1]|uniref:hypothetical protein n=1 Tax=Dyadobacter sp. BHUBP1 TaxID=3424178 RepID=UPI003D33E654